MKFTLLALAASLSLVSAAPADLNAALQVRQDSAICLKICGLEKPTTCGKGWKPVKQGECWTCCEDKPTPTPSAPPSEPSPPGVCLAICYLTKPDKCASGMEPRKQGECWTCCSASAPTPTPTPPPSDVCLLICYLKKPETCPPGYEPKKDGECWTCCGKSKPTPSPTPTLITKTLTPPPPAQTCLAICYFEKPDCGANGVAVKQGDCWTCCTK